MNGTKLLMFILILDIFSYGVLSAMGLAPTAGTHAFETFVTANVTGYSVNATPNTTSIGNLVLINSESQGSSSNVAGLFNFLIPFAPIINMFNWIYSVTTAPGYLLQELGLDFPFITMFAFAINAAILALLVAQFVRGVTLNG